MMRSDVSRDAGNRLDEDYHCCLSPVAIIDYRVQEKALKVKGYLLARLIELDGQRAQPAKDEVRRPFRLTGGEARVGQAAQQRIEGNLPFDAGQRRTQAVVNAVTEGDVPVIL